MLEQGNIRSGASASASVPYATQKGDGVQPQRSIADRVASLGRLPIKGHVWRSCLASSFLVALITLAGLRIAHIVGGPNLVILYMLAVVFSALRWGRWPALVSAVLSALLFDYFFVPPYRSVAVTDIWYSITLFSLLAVGFLVSILTASAREEARLARKREAHTAALYAFTESLADAGSLEQIVEAIGQHIRDTFRRPLVLLLPERGGLAARFLSDAFILDESEKTAAAWVFENGQPARAGSDMFPAIQAYYLPMRNWRGTVGVLGLHSQGLTESLPADQQQLLGSFVNQAALAITRAQLATEARRAELLQETDKLQKALLNSISHDLRTPLASVTGTLNSLLEDAPLLDISTQRELLETARDEAKRLDRLVRNLLDMSRLESDAVRVRTELCDVQDVVGTALVQLGEAAKQRRVAVLASPQLPLVPMDAVLIVQVIVNLLENALKYSETDSPIEVEARVERDRLHLSVRDRGQGIPDEDLERVFDKFYRCVAPGVARGAGLGLAICKGFIEAHGGKIRVERRPHGGTEATFTLPTSRTDE
jgi:two-component system, OmpR family, sensor histidine kinase KdpD